MFIDKGYQYSRQGQNGVKCDYFYNIPEGLRSIVYLQIFHENIALRQQLHNRIQNLPPTHPTTEPSNHQINGGAKIEAAPASQLPNSGSPIASKPSRKIKKRQPSKNQTKNIPKNFGKAIVGFIEGNKQFTRRTLSQFPQISYEDFMYFVKSKKKRINSIADLRELWTSSENNFMKPIRILSNCFLKKFSLEYIFNSRISNYGGHIKYRTRLLDALRDPEKFTNIKHF